MLGLTQSTESMHLKKGFVKEAWEALLQEPQTISSYGSQKQDCCQAQSHEGMEAELHEKIASSASDGSFSDESDPNLRNEEACHATDTLRLFHQGFLSRINQSFFTSVVPA